MATQVRYTRNVFLRGICIIYLFAFLSFYIQIPGEASHLDWCINADRTSRDFFSLLVRFCSVIRAKCIVGEYPIPVPSKRVMSVD